MKFKIGFEPEDKKKVFNYWDDVFKSNIWSDGKYTKLLEEKWSLYNSLETLAFSVNYDSYMTYIISYFKVDGLRFSKVEG